VFDEGLCGGAPFWASTPADSLDRIIGGATYPSELIPHFPPGAEAALMSALSPMPQDRPDSIEAFCDRLLAGLGSVREGRRSLEQMVGELSDDECAADDMESLPYEDDTVEIDPALGWAGSRWSHARNYTMRGISALSCGAFSFLLMQTAGVAALPGLVVAAVAIGAAAGLAPQIGSAISAVGFLVLMANATMQAQGILSMLPVAVVFAAAMSGWWIAWGRTEAAASATLTCALALGCLTGDALLAAGAAASIAAFWLGPASAAAATGMGALFARLAAAALSAGGVLGLSNVVAALGDALLLAAIVLVAAIAAATSLLLNAHAKRAEQGSNLAAIVAIAVAGIGSAAPVLSCRSASSARPDRFVLHTIWKLPALRARSSPRRRLRESYPL